MTPDEARAFAAEAEKTCAGPCGRTLPVGEFYRSSTSKGGRAARCKDCQRDADTTSVQRQRRRRERQPRTAAVAFDPAGWRDQAACRDMPGQFHPGPTDHDDIRACIDVCRRCPVEAACLDWALAMNEAEGVWGGMSEGERRQERKRRRSGRAAS